MSKEIRIKNIYEELQDIEDDFKIIKRNFPEIYVELRQFQKQKKEELKQWQNNLRHDFKDWNDCIEYKLKIMEELAENLKQAEIRWKKLKISKLEPIDNGHKLKDFIEI